MIICSRCLRAHHNYCRECHALETMEKAAPYMLKALQLCEKFLTPKNPDGSENTKNQDQYGFYIPLIAARTAIEKATAKK